MRDDDAVVHFRGDRLRRGRLAAGLTREALAARVGLRSADRIKDWELGVHAPQPRHVPALAGAVGIDPVWLYDVDPRAAPLALLRRVRGLSLQQLSAAAGVPLMTCQRLEQGRGRPDPAVLGRLAAALGVPVGRLMAAPAAGRAGGQNRDG